MLTRSRFQRRRARWATAARFSRTVAFLLLLHTLSAGPGLAGEPPRLDLNRASAAELEALPGIGAVKAAAILAVREERGGFASIDELESVRGIGPQLAQKLRSLVQISRAQPPSATSRGSGGPGSREP